MSALERVLAWRITGRSETDTAELTPASASQVVREATGR